jgi:hypothetical protein
MLYMHALRRVDKCRGKQDGCKFVLRVCLRLGGYRWFATFRNEDQCGRIHAISFASRSRAVVEYMSKVRTAFTIYHLYALHAIAMVFDQPHSVGMDGCIKTWPAGTRIEFCFGRKNRLQ